MARAVTIVLTGDKRLNRKLARLAAKDARRVIRQASRPALRPVKRAAQRNAPHETGRLERSITIRAVRRSRLAVGSRVTTKEGHFKGETFYGGFQEWGWTHGKRNRALRGPHIEGTKFMRRAADEKRQAALTIYRTLIRRGIIAAAKRG